ncbi:MAG: RagB/SusD family nutrient uptake outer membrane protein [Anditalea sp.]
MKKLRYSGIILLFFIFISVSCNEDELLTEVPKDFLTPENSYTTPEGFNATLTGLIASVQGEFYGYNDQWQRYVMFGQDIDLAVSGLTEDGLWYAIQWNTMTPDNGPVVSWWRSYYSLIFRANTIINRADEDVVTWASEQQKNEIVGAARFVRAFAYRLLANMWGGVPITLEETSSVRFDYTKATQEEVYQLCVEDLTFATQWMRSVNDGFKGGEIPRAAAYHVLAEVYIAMGKYPEAIQAASAVINDPNFELMTERFGVYKDFTWTGYDYRGEYEPWGDVYWDLFREGNYHRSSGNKEAIWNLNLEFQSEGLVYETSFERWWGPWNWALRDVDGVENFLKDTLMGRPVGVIRPTPYASEQIWNYKDDWDRDIRNSEFNIQRKFYFTNPSSKYYGQEITEENANPSNNNFRMKYPYFMKFTMVDHFPLTTDPNSGEKHSNGRNYKDLYIIRLTETFLLRAEAHHLNGSNDLAAADINEVRERAKATPVSAADVDLDLILDERARELYGEEFRLNTLLRMGKLKEYVRKYHYATLQQGLSYSEGGFIDLLPIPQREIDSNKEATLDQNPGY